MLNPNDRRLLFELLRPPNGHRLDHAVGMTYSLDLMALLVTPLAFASFDTTNEDGRVSASPQALLESLRRSADRMTVFCQAGQTKVPPHRQNLFAYLEGSVFPVNCPHPEGVFHPKLWVLRFVPVDDPEGGSAAYRLICGSRNLTFDRSWDTVLCLEGEYEPRTSGIEDNEPLAEFLEASLGWGVAPLEASRAARVRAIADELRRVVFEPPDGFEAVRFRPMYPGNRDTDLFNDEELDRLAVISPFLSDGQLGSLLNCVAAEGETTLVSRLEALHQLRPAVRDRFTRCYLLDPSAETEGNVAADPQGESPQDDDETGDGAQESIVVDDDSGALQGLHAKIYLADIGRYGMTWIGSANATRAAFTRNVELLVELEGPVSSCGVDAMLNADNPDGFHRLLQTYVPPDEPPEVDAVAERLQASLDACRRALGRLPWSASVTPNEQDSDLYDLLIERPDGYADALPEGVALKMRPVTLPGSRARAEEDGWEFRGLSVELLTAFFAIEATAREADQTLAEGFVLRARLAGAPDDRCQRILRSLLANPQQFMRFLLMLLADDGLDAQRALAATAPPSDRGGTGSGSGPLRLPLLEPLLRTLATDPHRLEPIASLVEDLLSDEAGRQRLPEGFEELWSSVWQVCKNERGGS